jgi:hypothetical protein
MASGNVNLSGGGTGFGTGGGTGFGTGGGAGEPKPSADASAGGGRNSFTNAIYNNGAVQDAMYEHAQDAAHRGMSAAKEGAGVAISELGKYVREGPAGVSILCFLGGIVTFAVGFCGCLNVFSIIGRPFSYVLHLYLTGFGLVSILLEADIDAISKMKVIGKIAPLMGKYQEVIFNRASFLTEQIGRGLFYFFIGSLAITQCLVCVLFLVGLWNVLMGAICILMSCGVNPVHHLQPQSHDDQAQLPLQHSGSTPAHGGY